MTFTLVVMLLVTSEEPFMVSKEEFTLEFDASDEDQAVHIAHQLLNDLQGTSGVDALVEEGWGDPVIEETLQANVFCSSKRIADLCTGITHLQRRSSRKGSP